MHDIEAVLFMSWFVSSDIQRRKAKLYISAWETCHTQRYIGWVTAMLCRETPIPASSSSERWGVTET